MPTSRTHTCSRCGVEKPLDTDHFGRDSRAKSGYKGTCKECLSAARLTDSAARQRDMTQAEYEAFRKDQRKLNRKSYYKVRAQSTPEEQAAKARHKYVRDHLPGRLKTLDRLEFVAVMAELETSLGAWTEFRDTVLEALRVTYGCDGLSREDLMAQKETPAYREYRRNHARMLQSETSLLMDVLDDGVRGWNWGRSQSLEEARKKVAEFTEEEIEFARNYAPQREKDELICLSPRARDEFEAELDAMVDASQARDRVMSDEDQIHMLVISFMGMGEHYDDETPLERKHRIRQTDRMRRKAEEALDKHPNQDLVRSVIADYEALVSGYEIEDLDDEDEEDAA